MLAAQSPVFTVRVKQVLKEVMELLIIQMLMTGSSPTCIKRIKLVDLRLEMPTRPAAGADFTVPCCSPVATLHRIQQDDGLRQAMEGGKRRSFMTLEFRSTNS